MNQKPNATKDNAPIPWKATKEWTAAYALNLCTVSVSQIIDYNDVLFLEREYETILNNLNLENMPKDDALLNILKQLLDVITFFRIQEGDKKMLEKEYQHKLKNAIWSAVPAVGVIGAGGLGAMAVSLVSQIGIGYMNYRKEKASISLEHEKNKWELQRTAMEQFNGLRRELFDTAWRLAEKHKFSDAYRLTERQISRFNQILMDADPLRRYERLKYIKDSFDAYPPFQYYLGNAAFEAYQHYGDDIGTEYRDYAETAFCNFLEKTEKCGLLREDQLRASCALELFDLYQDKGEDNHLDLMETAKKSSGNAYDVLELCLLAYLKVGETEKAKELLEMLVNENYNTAVNAQLLSSLYIASFLEISSDENQKKAIREQYRKLELRATEVQLIPMPNNPSEDHELAYQKFLTLQKEALSENYADVLHRLITKYENDFDNLYRMPGDIHDSMIALFTNLCKDIKALSEEDAAEFDDLLCKGIDGSGLPKSLSAEMPRNIPFAMIVQDAFSELAASIKNDISALTTMVDITTMEYELDLFCEEHGFLQRAYITASPKEFDPIAATILGKGYEEKQAQLGKVDECRKVITAGKKAYSELIRENANKDKEKIAFHTSKSDVDYYFKRNKTLKTMIMQEVPKIVPSPDCIVAVLNDRSLWDQDLVFTTEGIVALKRSVTVKTVAGSAKYSNITWGQRHNSLDIGKHSYSEEKIYMGKLLAMVNELAKVSDTAFANSAWSVDALGCLSPQKVAPVDVAKRAHELSCVEATELYETNNCYILVSLDSDGSATKMHLIEKDTGAERIEDATTLKDILGSGKRWKSAIAVSDGIVVQMQDNTLTTYRFNIERRTIEQIHADGVGKTLIAADALTAVFCDADSNDDGISIIRRNNRNHTEEG